MYFFQYIGGMEKELLTPTEFAYKKNMGVATVYQHMRGGRIQFVVKRLGTRSIKMIPKEELEKFKQP